MGSERRPVCLRCAQIKQACDGRLPCSRCVRLSLPCRPRDAISPKSGHMVPPPTIDIPKARIRRVQTGCLMCKRRKKKCDEIKPKCGDCRRLCLDCVWPPERQLKDGGDGPTPLSPESTTTTTTKSPACHSSPPESPESDELCPPSLPTKAEAGRARKVAAREQSSADKRGIPDSLSTATTIVTTGLESPESLTLVTTSPTLTVTPTSAASYFTVQTPGENAIYYTSPIVSARAQGGFDCALNQPAATHEGWTDVYSPVAKVEEPESPVLGTLSVYRPDMFPALTSTPDRALLNHYVRTVSTLLSRRPSTNNPYNNYLLPMAQRNPLVLHSILALAGNHWRKNHPAMATRGLVHQIRAQKMLAGTLPHVDERSADVALVSSLLLCMTELFDGQSEGWKLHLKGAKRLLAALKRQQDDSWTGQYNFLLRLSRFLDSAATTATCRPPLMEEEEREAARLEQLSASSSDEEDSAVYGIPRQLFHFVDIINSLADKRKTRVDAAAEAVFRAEGLEVEDKINSWSFEHGSFSAKAMAFASSPLGVGSSNGGYSATGTKSSPQADVWHATMAYEHAVRLRLHQIVEGYDAFDPKVMTSVAMILDSVQRLPCGGALEPCILFPLVMAGGACYLTEHREAVRDRLMVMERTSGFGYVFNARELMERVWRQRDETTHQESASVNWAKIRYEEMNGLVVF